MSEMDPTKSSSSKENVKVKFMAVYYFVVDNY